MKSFITFGVPNDGDMADCFFLHHEVINYDVTNSTVVHYFYADIEENDIFVFSWKFEL